MRVALGCVLVMLAACTSSRRKPDGTGPAQVGTLEQVGSDTIVSTLEHTACFGICPVYKLSIRTDGTVKYEGTSFVKVKGRAEWLLSPEAMTHLRDAFYKARFSSFRDTYEEQSVTDAATTIVSYVNDGKSKIVRHYAGDRTAPEDLRWLEHEIESIVQIEKWIGTDQERSQNAAEWH
jgi:hypothetical protein